MPQRTQMLYLMIGSRMNKCTRTLITAFTNQINGGNAMTPGLSWGSSAGIAGMLQPLPRQRDKIPAAAMRRRL
jgi:hypothetical protein